MNKINVLSSKIFNRISAGEVVDRPYSVVKEIVENSIDSGAQNITIDIQNGGISSIVISDDGCGIEKSQLKKAILPHATSKISTIKDLDDIKTLGFRGEALASIASVSKLKIISKTSDEELGSCLYAEGGEILEFNDCGAQNGTVVTVNNLFFNTPAREKFLKTARSEEGEITSVIIKFILGNPNVSFKYIADGEVVYQSYGDGLESAMVNVYGIDVIKNCFYIDVEKNGLIIKGYLGKHHFTKGNRSGQTVFLNGRNIINQTISAAISNAYSNYLMKHRYPFYVINVQIPTSLVDVNVHPNKLDVRFANNQIVYSSIYSVISKVLDGSSEALNIVKSENLKPYKDSNEINIDYATHNCNNNITSSKSFNDLVFNDSGTSSIDFKDIEQKTNSPTVDIFAENKAYLEKLEKEKKTFYIPVEANIEQISLKTKNQLSYVGQVLNTFLVLEDGVDVYLVDQHAAHERILFDKLIEMQEKKQIDTQPLLVPFVLNCNNVECEFVYNNLSQLISLGIDISEFGKNAFKVSAIPLFLSDINLEKFFDSILSDLSMLKTITLSNVLRDKLAQKACKSAIKAGDKLDETQVNVLLNKLNEDIGLKCPHGRPIVVKISRVEIDKWFKRIV